MEIFLQAMKFAKMISLPMICLALNIVLLSCGAGTTGRIALFNFQDNKYRVQDRLETVIAKGHKLPDSMKIPKEFDVIETYYIYFYSPPIELYRVRFAGDSSIWNNSNGCSIGIVGALVDGTIKIESQLNEDEKNRIRDRFEKEILAPTELGYSVE